MRIDCHIHPLAHRYYYDRQHPESLTERDKNDIAAVLAMSVERGLDAVAITDHDLALSGLWAKEYAKKVFPTLKVIAGCECELYFMREWIHVLALNINQPLVYTPYTSPYELAAQATAQGAITVLAHPMCYSIAIYQNLKDVLDGIEYRNGAQEHAGRLSYETILNQEGYTGLRLYNSDYHYPSQPAAEQWQAATEISAASFLQWFANSRIEEAD